MPRVPRKYVVTTGSFVAKGICAFVINYCVANRLSVEHFALWSTFFSFGTILSVADCGLGQLVLTTLHEQKRAETGDARLLSNSVAGLGVLSTVAFLCVLALFAYGNAFAGISWKEAIVALIVFRLVAIPYGAVLSAQDRFHERKLIESLSYAAAGAFIWAACRMGWGVSAMLFGLNAVVSLGAFATCVRASALISSKFRFEFVDRAHVIRLLADAFPYFVNNLSGVVVYGGFVAISSFVVGEGDIAKLSLLHNLIFLHLYQLFDVIFRTTQVQMFTGDMTGRLLRVVVATYLFGLIGSLTIGPWMFKLCFAKYTFTALELATYVTFAFAEVYYLLLTTRMQMRGSYKRVLQTMAGIKLIGFVSLGIGASLSGLQISCLAYASLLLVCSVAMDFCATLVSCPFNVAESESQCTMDHVARGAG